MLDKKQTLVRLQKETEIYVILSKCTRSPFVWCDEETFDDEIFIYFQENDAKAKAEQLNEQGQPVVFVKVPNKNFLPFYAGLFPMGVNAIVIDGDTENALTIQLEELVRKPDASKLPQGQMRVENPALHLTGLYFMQELRREKRTELTEELKEMQKELLSHYAGGTYIIALNSENGGVVLLKSPQGIPTLPLFTDIQEFQKFQMVNKTENVKPGIVKAENIINLLPPDASAVVLNPFGMNVPLNVERKAKG